MDLNRLTEKSQQALHDAQTKAMRQGHTEVDGEHLLLGLLDQPDGVTVRLLTGLGVDIEQLRERVERDLQRRPSVTETGAQPGQVTVTRRLATDLDAAEREAPSAATTRPQRSRRAANPSARARRTRACRRPPRRWLWHRPR